MAVNELVTHLANEVGKVIVGQKDLIEQLAVCFIADGHVLLEGPPGVAKTLAARSFAAALGLNFSRVQFTPDLMPSDITGTLVFDMSTAQFHLRKGPVFTQLLLADEINRTPAKTQSALLQAMEERTVTIDGTDHLLQEPYFVMATQNPIEHEGTYPLPEAQLDRFLMKLYVEYPSVSEEKQILQSVTLGQSRHRIERSDIKAIEPAVLAELCREARTEAEAVTVEERVLDYLLSLVRSTRENASLELGASPRAALALLHCSKILALIRERNYVIPEDIQEMAAPILRHRLLLSADALIAGLDADDVVRNCIAANAVPR